MRLLLTFLFLIFASLTNAADYKNDAASTLSFEWNYEGDGYVGRFQKFDAMIQFDPESLDISKFDVTIDLTSVSSDSDESDDVLKSEDFFSTDVTPNARYEATTFKALGDNKFVAEGTLTLRGISTPVPLNFTWTPGAKPTLTGTATIMRLAFNVGSKDWSDTEALPDEVKVSTTLTLSPTSP